MCVEKRRDRDGVCVSVYKEREREREIEMERGSMKRDNSLVTLVLHLCYICPMAFCPDTYLYIQENVSGP